VDARLDEVHDAVHLDGALGEALQLEELAEGVAVELAVDPLPAGRLVGLDPGAELAGRVLPQLGVGATALVLGDLEPELVGCHPGLLGGHPPAAHVHEALRVAHDERPHSQPEVLDVAERQVVNPRDPHRPGLGVQARRELAERVDPPADAVLGLEDQRVVPRAGELVAGDEAGHPGADDDDPLAGLLRTTFEAVHALRVPLARDGRCIAIGCPPGCRFVSAYVR
jgi:hypothetical protein